MNSLFWCVNDHILKMEFPLITSTTIRHYYYSN